MTIGTIIQWASNTLPTGWLLCDGSAVSRTTYADLFDVIGTTFGTGDGSTTFNLPDLRGRVAVGKSSETEFDTLGETGGSKYIQEHTHILSKGGQGFVTSEGNYAGVMGDWGAFSTSGVQDVTSGNSGNLQPYIVVNYIIKATTPDSIKISELEELTSADDNDVLPIVDISANETKKISYENLQKSNKVVLFQTNNANGDSGNIVLSDNASNYSYIEIYFGGSSGITSCHKIVGTTTEFNILRSYTTGDQLYFYATEYTLNNKNLNVSSYSRGLYNNQSFDLNFNSIYKVIGYK